MSRRRMTARACGFVAGASAVLFGLFLILWLVGTNDGLWLRLQLRADILPEAGISEETLRNVDAMLADCLRGDENAFLDEAGRVRRVEVFGDTREVFDERERVHMEDCRRLFALLKAALLASGVSALLLSALARRLSAPRRAYLFGIFLPLAALSAFALWAINDFDSAFRAFHGLLFTNDLWLLDPATELLIRLCPQSMFEALGLMVAAAFLVWTASVTALTLRPRNL